ncbi:MAG: hypothetical protein IT260_07625 [Saprospiraceae bacterium]|nr:hypothetical protein [Saprospiraceae bacterium]
MSRNAHTVVFSCLLWCFPLWLHSQEGPYSFTHLGTAEGLSNDLITSLTCDTFGFLWVGTPNGLNRFDGRRFRTFRKGPDPANDLPGDYVAAISEAPDGRLWVSTDKGLCRLEPRSLRLEPVPLPEGADTIVRHHAVGKVYFDRQGRAWVTRAWHLSCLDLKTGKSQTFQPRIDTVRHPELPLYLDRQDRIWIVHNGFVFQFDPATGQTRAIVDAVTGENNLNILGITEDDEGQIWLSSWGRGVYRYNPVSGNLDLMYRNLYPIRGVMPDKTSSGEPFFWVAGGLSGLFLYFPKQDLRQVMTNDPRDPYSHNGFYTTVMYRNDRTGDVWIGTEVGLEHYAPTAIRFGRAIIPKEPDFGPFNLVSDIVQDQTDPTGQTYYVGVWANYFFRWHRPTNVFERFKRSPKLPLQDAEVFCMTQDRAGLLWLGVTGGITSFDPRTRNLRNYNGFFTQPNRRNKVITLMEGRDGVLWLGANAEGLCRLRPGARRPERIPLPPEVLYPNTPDLFVHRIDEDTLGRIWMATNRGVVRYNPANGEAKVFPIPGKMMPYDCAGILVASSGSIWAMCDRVLVEMDYAGKPLRSFDNEQGILAARGFYLQEDKLGNIWFNSDYLLHCLTPRTGTFTYYGQADGLFSNAPTDAMSLMPNGEIFVGFQNTFNFFDPARLRRNTTPPTIAITAIRVLNEEASLDRPLVLLPGQNMLTVEFAALNFSQPERNRYAYQLEGFDRDWIYTDRPVAVYTNLDGGRYTLRLKAANNDGIWNEQGATLQFEVIPPLYRRWYFFVALAALLAGAIAAVSWYRHQQRRRLEQFRERLARDLHDEMGSTLSSIRFFSDFAQTQIGTSKPETLPVLQRISQSATSLSESMQDIIWAMKTRHEHLEDMASRMTEFGLRLLEARGIQFKSSIDEHFPVRKLLPEQRRNVYLIFKEALNNAVKYARCSKVELVFRMEKNGLLMAVVDNGQGFDPLAQTTGNGLHNMLQRAKDIGGDLLIESAPGKGSTVQLKIKM